MKRITVLVAAMALLLSLPAAAGDVAKGLSAADAFAKITAMAGSWDGNVMAKDGPVEKVEFGVTAAGSAVTEKLFAGQRHEMLNVYYIDGNDLRLTHYCSAGNQPRMKLNKVVSTADQLVFEFDGVSGLKSANEEHIHHATIKLVGANEVESVWYSEGAKTAGKPKTFFLRRAAK